LIWILTLLLSSAEARPNLSKIGSCSADKEAKKVMLIKQWHLPPTTITKSFKEKYPQERNQTVIYQSLNDLVKKKKLQIVVAEGCEGEIGPDFKTAFNGWDLEALKKQAQTRGYERIVAHVPLKLEARHGDKVLTLCGDNDKQIQEGNLRISNLRGWIGFWSRLSEHKSDPEKLKLYSEAAADVMKVPKDTSQEELQTQIKERIKQELELLQKSINERNTSFVKALEGRDFQTAAIVIGGLHATDLKEKLQAAGFACDVFEPYGYIQEEEKLIQEFQKALK
jgi:hypothetical protein